MILQNSDSDKRKAMAMIVLLSLAITLPWWLGVYVIVCTVGSFILGWLS